MFLIIYLCSMFVRVGGSPFFYLVCFSTDKVVCYLLGGFVTLRYASSLVVALI